MAPLLSCIRGLICLVVIAVCFGSVAASTQACSSSASICEEHIPAVEVSLIQRSHRLHHSVDQLVPQEHVQPESQDWSMQAGSMIYGMPGWSVAVGVCLLASSLTVFGFVLQKQGASSPGSHWRLGDMVLSRQWVFGLLLVACAGFPMDLLAYSLAPLSLTTPLSGVTVALNLVFAERLLGETLQAWPDIPATGLIMCGTLLTTVTGPHQEPVWNSAMLWSLLEDSFLQRLLMAMTVAVTLGIGLMWWFQEPLAESAKRRYLNPAVHEVVLPAFVAGAVGCLANINLKAVGVLLRNSGTSHELAPWVIMTVGPAAVQLNYINRGLQLYPQTVFIPIYTAFLVLLSTIVGAVFYQEHTQFLNHLRLQICFAIGICCIIAGIGMFAFRSPENCAQAPAEVVTQGKYESEQALEG